MQDNSKSCPTDCPTACSSSCCRSSCSDSQQTGCSCNAPMNPTPSIVNANCGCGSTCESTSVPDKRGFGFITEKK